MPGTNPPGIEIWSLSTSSGLHSALAGVLGGVAFTAIVLFMQADESRRGMHEVQKLAAADIGRIVDASPPRIRLSYVHGLRHLIVAFFAFVATALLYGVIAGYDAAILTPTIVIVPTAAAFGVGVVELTVALTWMTGRFSALALPTARRASRWLAGMAALFVADTAGDVGLRVGAVWFDIGMSVLGFAAGVFVAWRLPPSSMIDNKVMSTRNHVARTLSAATLIIAVLIFSIVTIIPDDSALVDGQNLGLWQRVLVLVGAVVGTVWAWVALGTLMWALPAPNPNDTPNPDDDYVDALSWRTRRTTWSNLHPKPHIAEPPPAAVTDVPS